MKVGLPEKARGDRAPGPPCFAEATRLGLVRPRAGVQMIAKRDLQTQIGSRPNIGSAECKKQIDLGAPSPDSPEGQQFGEGSLVLGGAEPGEIEFAVVDLRGKVAGIAHLLPAETTGAQRAVVEREESFRRQWPADPEQPLVHRRSSIN